MTEIFIQTPDKPHFLRKSTSAAIKRSASQSDTKWARDDFSILGPGLATLVLDKFTVCDSVSRSSQLMRV